MAGLYKETTLGRDDKEFIRTYKSLDQLLQDVDCICLHPLEKWTGKQSELAPRILPKQKYVCNLQGYYGPRDDSGKRLRVSQLNPYPSSRDSSCNDELNSNDECGSLEDTQTEEPEHTLSDTDDIDNFIDDDEMDQWKKMTKKHIEAKILEKIVQDSVRKKIGEEIVKESVRMTIEETFEKRKFGSKK